MHTLKLIPLQRRGQALGGQVGRRPYTAGLCPKSCIFGMEAISTAWLKEWCGLLKGTWRLVNLWKPSHSSSTATSSSHHPYLLLQVMRSSKNLCKLITRNPSCVDIWIWLATWRVWEHEKKHSMLLGGNTKKKYYWMEVVNIYRQKYPYLGGKTTYILTPACRTGNFWCMPSARSSRKYNHHLTTSCAFVQVYEIAFVTKRKSLSMEDSEDSE